MEQDLQYHQSRAMAELDLAYRADQPEVSDAHAQLAALHMQKLDELGRRKPVVAPQAAFRSSRATAA
jgi:hypothetical protein